jgi:hypothetical protein
MSPLIKFGFQLVNNSRRSFALLRGTLKLVAQFSGSVGTLGMFGNWANLIWPAMFGISERKRATANKKPQFFRDARPPQGTILPGFRSLGSPISSDEKNANARRGFWLHPANARVRGFPELVPQSIRQFRDPI